MVKRFRVKIPVKLRINSQQRLNKNLPDYVKLKDNLLPLINIDLPDIELPSKVVPAAFINIPTKRMYNSLPVNQRPLHWQYVQHRQMNEGRAMALGIHPRRKLLKRDGNSWLFSLYFPGGRNNPSYYKEYIVNWDGVLVNGNPPIGVSNTTFGQYAPDSFSWAVYFLVNGIVDDSLWFPVSSKYPQWNSLNIGQFVPEYNLSLV